MSLPMSSYPGSNLVSLAPEPHPASWPQNPVLAELATEVTKLINEATAQYEV